MQACKDFNALIDGKLWRYLSLRDYNNFLCTMPISEQASNLPTKASDIKTTYDDKNEAARAFLNPLKEPLSDNERDLLRRNLANMSSWKRFYIQCHNSFDLNGYWIGNYGNDGYELIRIYQKGYKVYAKKLTGDQNVPAGKLTWKMTLDRSLAKGKGEVHMADASFMDSRWSTAYIDLSEKDVINIKWFAKNSLGNWYTFTFASVRAGCKDFSRSLVNQRISSIYIDNDR